MKKINWRWRSLLLLLLAPFIMAVAPGEKAPDFTAKNQNGKEVSLAKLRNQFVLLYFYPKDESPGCTAEACSFRDQYKKIKELNTVVLGISRQDVASHMKFAEKNHLPFDLLVDEDAKIAKAYGVALKPGIGLTERQSILIGKDGKVLHFYEHVNPQTHVAEVIEDIKKAK